MDVPAAYEGTRNRQRHEDHSPNDVSEQHSTMRTNVFMGCFVLRQVVGACFVVVVAQNISISTSALYSTEEEMSSMSHVVRPRKVRSRSPSIKPMTVSRQVSRTRTDIELLATRPLRPLYRGLRSPLLSFPSFVMTLRGLPLTSACSIALRCGSARGRIAF